MKSKYEYGVLMIALAVITMGATVYADTMGYWRIEDGVSGVDIVSSADSSGNGKTAGQWSANAAAVKYSSDVGGAYVYDPVTQQYSANTGSMLASGNTSTDNSQLLVSDMSALSGTFTLEMFVKIEDAGGAANFTASTGNRLFNLDGSASCNGAVGATSSATTYLSYRLGSGVTDYSSNFEDGLWHHLAYVADFNGVDSTTFQLYMDGTKVKEGTYAGQFTAQSNNDLRFGISSSSMSDLDWFVDEVRLSDTALASSDFLQLTSIPEPATLALISIFGVGSLAFRRIMM